MTSFIPRVFISYSHDSDAHRAKVLDLAQRLRRDGIDAQLDQYVDGTPAEKWPRWMLDQLDSANFVLLICTPTYYRRFRGHEDPEQGKGVDWEGAVITQELYDKRGVTKKFVPVLFEGSDEDSIPEPARGQTIYRLPSETAYQRLYDFLLGQSGVEPGPLGALRRRPRRQAQPLILPPGASVPADASEPTPTTSRRRVLLSWAVAVASAALVFGLLRMSAKARERLPAPAWLSHELAPSLLELFRTGSDLETGSGHYLAQIPLSDAAFRKQIEDLRQSVQAYNKSYAALHIVHGDEFRNGLAELRPQDAPLYDVAAEVFNYANSEFQPQNLPAYDDKHNLREQHESLAAGWRETQTLLNGRLPRLREGINLLLQELFRRGRFSMPKCGR